MWGLLQPAAAVMVLQWSLPAATAIGTVAAHASAAAP
jgi:hypothetical protein